MEHLPSRKHTKAIENGHLISLNAIEIVDLPTKNGDVPSVFVNVHQRVEDLNGLAAPGILTTHPLPKNKNIPSPRCLGCNIFLNKNGQKSFPDTKKNLERIFCFHGAPPAATPLDPGHGALWKFDLVGLATHGKDSSPGLIWQCKAPILAGCLAQFLHQWIGLRENLQETIDFPMKYGAFL